MKKGSDVRDRILSQVEFDALMTALPAYLKPVVAMAWVYRHEKGGSPGTYLGPCGHERTCHQVTGRGYKRL